MYKVKLSPEEALETIKLRMKYDSSKTLTENKLFLEQVDISGDIRDIKDELGSSYEGQGEVVEFADYGVPQKRQRLISVFTKDKFIKDYFKYYSLKEDDYRGTGKPDPKLDLSTFTFNMSLSKLLVN